MATAQEVRTLALSLPRTEEALVRDQVKFRVNRIVYVALSRDELSMGFAFPREERLALIASEPEKFFMPAASDERYNWVQVRLPALDDDEMTELVVSAWAMVVPKRLSADRLARLDVKAAGRRGESAGSPQEESGTADG
ncbi:MmcQ/YjbR family DNA-binding protein [Streptomyces sp. NPDC059766]|uniref:MmcQ/YjbR family DNA-binding protein n=1 Tax=Streptomyces sp. NPDC059766 TaxID=3346940 RepID=UPI003664F17E